MALKYTGGGYGGWLPEIPARDLNDDEVKQFGGEAALLKTGLYEKPSAAVSQQPIGKKLTGGAENKADAEKEK
jgi:hypothetical protein